MKRLFCFYLFLVFSFNAFAITEVIDRASVANDKADAEIINIYKSCNYKATVNKCNKLLNSYPNDKIAKLYLAYSYEMLGEYNLAQAAYLKCLECDDYSQTDMQRIKYNLSNVYLYLIRHYTNCNNINQAFNIVKAAQYYLPEDSRFYYSDAELNIKIDNYQEAIKLIKKSWEIDTTDMGTRLNTNFYKLQRLGVCYKKLGKSYYGEWKKYIYQIYKKNQDNDNITLMMADIYFINDEERSKRNHLRNKVMQRYLATHENRLDINVFIPVKGRWFVSSGTFHGGLDTHNGYDGYCIDLVRIDENGKTRADNYKTNEDSFTFGENVYAAYDGVVEIAHCGGVDNPPGELNGATLNAVVIRHNIENATFYTKYLHLKQYSSKLRPGQKINAGDYVGQCGNSGYSTGCHLHFGIYDENHVSLPVTFIVNNQDNNQVNCIPKFKDIIETY